VSGTDKTYFDGEKKEPNESVNKNKIYYEARYLCFHESKADLERSFGKQALNRSFKEDFLTN